MTDHDRMNYWWRQAKEARAERDALAHQVEAVRDVLARWQVEGYSALIRRIRRALDGEVADQ